MSFSQNEELAGLILKGAAWAFTLILIGILFAFGHTNRPSAAQDEGMSIDVLSWAVTAVLGILNVSTNGAVTYMFSVSHTKENDNPGIQADASGQPEVNRQQHGA